MLGLKNLECIFLDESHKKFIVLQEVTGAIRASGDRGERIFSQLTFLKTRKKTIDKLEFFCKLIDVDISSHAFLGLEEGSAYGSHKSHMDMEMGRVFFRPCPGGKSRDLNLGKKNENIVNSLFPVNQKPKR